MKDIVAYAIALGFAIFAVHVDLHTSEVQAAVLVIVVGGFVLGMFAPERAWRWVLILGLSILIGDNLAPRLGLGPGDVVLPWNFGTIIALVPAAIGTYVGVGVRNLVRAAASTLK